jgi:hypothetical protein
MLSFSSVEVTRTLDGLGRWDGKETEKIKKVLENRWAHTFRVEVFPLMPVYQVSKQIFSSNNGRPSNDATT